MRRGRRVVALVCAFLLVAAGCSRPRQEASKPVGKKEGVSSLVATPGQPSTATAAPEVAAANKAIAPTKKLTQQGPSGYGAVNPYADVSHAKKVGQLIKVMSTSYTNPNTWTGVTADTIKLAFSRDETNCGANIINLVNQAGGNFATDSRFYRKTPTDQQTANKEGREAIEALVKYWNDNAERVAQDAPAVATIMAKMNKPGYPFYGRKLIYEIVDGGSYQCPDKQTSAAVKIADQVKPFAVITDDIPGIDGSGWNMASQLNARIPADRRPMHFGPLWHSDKDYERWAPFVWAQFTSGTQSARLAASWICSKLNGRNAIYSPQYKNTVRKFGLIYPEAPNAKTVAAEFKGFIEQFCGRQIISSDAEVTYPQDPGVASSRATDIAVKFKLLGVTSVISLLDLLFPLFLINIGARGQDYHPEWVWTGTAYTDSTTVQRLYDQSMVDKTSIGISPFGVPGGFGYGGGDPFWVWHYSHQVAPDGKPCDPSSDAGMWHAREYCLAPGAIVTLYYSLLPLIGGIYFAGPDLKPINVTKGLQAYPETRYGLNGPTDDPRPALVGAGPGQYYFIVDAVEWRWRSNYVSPPPEHKRGWVEYLDCQRHYKLWPDQLSIQWEKNGPNYNAWCGDAKYAPPQFIPGESPDHVNKEHRDSTGNPLPYETDDYPKWEPPIT